jgi:uncharacterized membrane protein YfcA
MSMVDPVLLSLGLLIGTLVGMTGIGGGALLTPLLILFVGVRPVMAVGTDLAFAAVTKLVGGGLHVSQGTADVRLALRLALGGVPGAVLGAVIVGQFDLHGGADALVTHVLAIALLLAAGVSVIRATGWSWPLRRGARTSTAESIDDQPGLLGAATLGFGVGVLVGMTSIGSGSLLMATFAMLYRLPAQRAVGSDVLYGALLASAAAVATGAAGRVDLGMLAALLLGSIPGVLVGGWLCGRVPGRPLRLGVAAMLAVAGFRLL